MKFIILLLCLKFIGVLCEKNSVELSVNEDTVSTDTYRYHDNLEATIICHSRGENRDFVTMKYIPREGEPFTTITKSSFNVIYFKLTTENHNGIIECHIRGKEENLTITTRLESIEALQANGLYVRPEVVRGFEVNGLLLSSHPGYTLLVFDPQRHQYSFKSSENETVIAKFLKGDDEKASCRYDHQFWSQNNDSNGDFTFHSIFEEGYTGIGILCKIYNDNNENITYSLSIYEIYEYDQPPVKGLPTSNILIRYATNDIDSVCITPQEKQDKVVSFLQKAPYFVLAEYGGYTMTCANDWCYDGSQVECLESTEENKTPKTCTFVLKDGHNETIVKCPGIKDNPKNYIKLVKKTD